MQAHSLFWVRGGKAHLPELKNVEMVGIGVFLKDHAQHFSVILPGAAFAEKSGTVVNFEGQEQKFKRAILPPGQCKPLSEILMMWMNRKTASGAA